MNPAPVYTVAGGFHVRASRVPGLGKQSDRFMLEWCRQAPDERYWTMVGENFVRETTALIAADAAGLPGRDVSSQTIGDLEIFGVGLRVGPRVTLVDRVELSHAEAQQ